MKYVHLGVTLLLLGAFEAVTAAENTPAALVAPTIEYQGEVTIEAGLLVLSGPLHYTPDKERRTLLLRGVPAPAQVVIVRRDKGLVWVLNPERKSFYQTPLTAKASESSGIPSRELVEKTQVGRETIDGVDATKYRVKFAEQDGIQLSGDIWVSDDHILLRIEGETVDRETRQSRPFRMTISKLKIQPQPADLFEVPKDFAQVVPSHPTLGILAAPPRR